MSVQERKQRERAERERLIVATARELAEEQGWDAVTTRRLAERIVNAQEDEIATMQQWLQDRGQPAHPAGH